MKKALSVLILFSFLLFMEVRAQVSATIFAKSEIGKRIIDEEYRNNVKSVNMSDRASEQEIFQLSKQKWQWMSDKNIEPLNELFHEKSMFIHMGGTWGKAQELDVIKTGNIWYKKAEIYSASVNIIGNTAILLNDIDLEAVVGGNTLTNPFMVTEVYVNEGGKWKMGSLTFSRLLRPVKMGNNNNQPQQPNTIRQ